MNSHIVGASIRISLLKSWLEGTRLAAQIGGQNFGITEQAAPDKDQVRNTDRLTRPILAQARQGVLPSAGAWSTGILVNVGATSVVRFL
jgi:hypothetical protein